jgi:sarcosine oxidase subunit beta
VAAVAIRVARDRVTGVDTSAGFIAADRVIIAAGVDTPALLSPLGLNLPLSRKVVSVVQTEPLPPCLDPVFGVANADCAGRQEVGGRLRFSGGRSDGSLDPARWLDASVPPAQIVHELIAHVAQVLPIVRDAGIARTWEGWIDLTPDALPVLDAPASVAGLVVAAGFSGHGFCLGPISGLLCADLAVARAPRHDLAAFRLARFSDHSGTAARPALHG